MGGMFTSRHSLTFHFFHCFATNQTVTMGYWYMAGRVSEASVFLCQRDLLNMVLNISVQVKGKILTTGSFLALHNLSSVITAGSCGIEGEDDSYDFGTGAGFYVDATEEKWKTNYRMFSYITKEVLKYLSCKHRLPKLKN